MHLGNRCVFVAYPPLPATAISEVKPVDVPGERCETINQKSGMFAALCYGKPFTLPLIQQTPDEAGDPLLGTIFQAQTWRGTLDPKYAVRNLNFDEMAICDKKIQLKDLLLARRSSRQTVTVSALNVPALPVLLHRYLCQKQTTIFSLAAAPCACFARTCQCNQATVAEKDNACSVQLHVGHITC